MAGVARRRVAMLDPELARAVQVARHGEGLRRQGTQVHLVAPAFEDTPLGAVDPAGVVGEEGREGVGHGFLGGPQLRQGRGPVGDYLLVAGAHGRAFGDILVRESWRRMLIHLG